MDELYLTLHYNHNPTPQGEPIIILQIHSNFIFKVDESRLELRF